MPATTRVTPAAGPLVAFAIFAALAAPGLPALLHALPYRLAQRLALFLRQLAVAIDIELLDELLRQSPAGVLLFPVPSPVSLCVPAFLLARTFRAAVLRLGGRCYREDKQHRQQSCQQFLHRHPPSSAN
jgi:hypothetical protein